MKKVSIDIDQKRYTSIQLSLAARKKKIGELLAVLNTSQYPESVDTILELEQEILDMDLFFDQLTESFLK